MPQILNTPSDQRRIWPSRRSGPIQGKIKAQIAMPTNKCATRRNTRKGSIRFTQRLAFESNMAGDDGRLDLSAQLITQEWRVLALAGQRFGLDLPARLRIENADVGNITGFQTPGRQTGHARSVGGNFGNRLADR